MTDQSKQTGTGTTGIGTLCGGRGAWRDAVVEEQVADVGFDQRQDLLGKVESLLKEGQVGGPGGARFWAELAQDKVGVLSIEGAVAEQDGVTAPGVAGERIEVGHDAGAQRVEVDVAEQDVLRDVVNEVAQSRGGAGTGILRVTSLTTSPMSPPIVCSRPMLRRETGSVCARG
jgi:hypothetical protein